LTELSSDVQTTSKVSDSVEFTGVDLRIRVVEWKFSELDTNSDRLVDLKELDRLGRLVKKLVQPTSCAVSFHTRCDLDFDSSLTLQEWKTCFDDDADTSLSAVDGSFHTEWGWDSIRKLGATIPKFAGWATKHLWSVHLICHICKTEVSLQAFFKGNLGLIYFIPYQHYQLFRSTNTLLPWVPTGVARGVLNAPTCKRQEWVSAGTSAVLCL